MDLKKVQKYIEAINTYYGFAVLVYVAILYVASHNHIFWWLLLALTPLLAGWTGYLINSFITLRSLKHGFRVLSNVMTYEIENDNAYILRYTSTLKAGMNHILVYPMGYQWTGSGVEGVPKISGDANQIAGIITRPLAATRETVVSTYKEVIPSEGEWHYWVVGLDRPAYKGDVIQIRYEQKFQDTKKQAKPCLYYPVSTATKRVELNVKFPANALPKTVYGSYIKPSDPRHAILAKGVVYDPEKQWATWLIEKPKRGYTYRIQWQ